MFRLRDLGDGPHRRPQQIFSVELVTRMGLVYLLFTLLRPGLWQIAVATVAGSVVCLSLYYRAWRKLTPELFISRKEFDPARLREITHFGGWLIVIVLGSALLLNTDLMIVNRTLGSEAQGYYGVLLSWLTILRGLFSAIGMLFSPSVVALHASGETARLVELTTKAMRMQGLVVATMVGVLCGLAGPALNWWLGPGFIHLAPLTWLILVPLVIEGSFYPVSPVLLTAEKVRFPAIVTLILGVSNVILGSSLALFTSMGVYGVALSSALMSILRHAVILPVYSARILHRPWHTLLQPLSQVVVQLGLAGALSLYASQYLHGRSLVQLAAVATLVGGAAAIPALAQMSGAERRKLLELVWRR